MCLASLVSAQTCDALHYATLMETWSLWMTNSHILVVRHTPSNRMLYIWANTVHEYWITCFVIGLRIWSHTWSCVCHWEISKCVCTLSLFLFPGDTQQYPWGFAAKVLELWRTSVPSRLPNPYLVGLSSDIDWSDARLGGIDSFLWAMKWYRPECLVVRQNIILIVLAEWTMCLLCRSILTFWLASASRACSSGPHV